MNLYTVNVFITTFTTWEFTASITVEAENEAEGVLKALDIAKHPGWYKQPEVCNAIADRFIPAVLPEMDFLSIGSGYYRIVKVGESADLVSVRKIENIDEEKILIGFIDINDNTLSIIEYPADRDRAIPVYASLADLMKNPRPSLFR